MDRPEFMTVTAHSVHDDVLDRLRALWRELHAADRPTPEWFAQWLAKVPNDCSCAEKFETFLAVNPPDLDNWLEWSVKAHNWVNRKLEKAEFGLLDAIELIQNATLGELVQLIKPTILSPIPHPENSRAIVVLACDEKTRKEFGHTRSRMEQYARNYNLDFVVIEKISKQTHACGNKYAYAQIADRWLQSLWLDTDVVVNPNAPNIFDSVPVGSWGLVDDLAVMENTEWFVSEFRMCQEVWGVEQSKLPSAWNSGVVVAPNNAVECYYPPPMRVPNVWCAEQHWHTQCLLDKGASVVTLGEEWNNGYPWQRWHDQISTSHFNHVNGCKPHSLRCDILKHLAAGNTTLDESLIKQARESWKPKWC